MGSSNKEQGGRLIVLLCVASASLSCTSLSTLVREERFDEFCRECEGAQVTAQESRDAALAFAAKADLEFSARLIEAPELMERFGIPEEASTAVHFFELRWQARTSQVGAVETEFMFLGDGRPSTFLSRIYDRDLPTPEAFEALPVPPAYSVREYEPETPRPEARFRGNGVVNAVTRAATLGRRGNAGRRLTPASARAIERWEMANRTPREAWDTEEQRLRDEREAERARVLETNEQRAREHAGFVARRDALKETIATRACATLENDDECVEVVAMSVDIAQASTTPTLVLMREYSAFPQCTLRVVYEGGPAPSLQGVQNDMQATSVETRHFP
ncbi:MAG: hypothetical protein AB8H86_26260 [Polyangiales bacterium]